MTQTLMTHEEIFAASCIKVGRQYRFDYPQEFTTLPDYSAHRGHVVTVKRTTTKEEADILWDDPKGDGNEQVVDCMFFVEAGDGWTGYAWESELRDSGELKR